MLGFLIVFMPAFLVKQVPSGIVGSATGLSTFGSQLAGLITPLVIGVLVDAFKGSFVAAFAYLIVFALVSVVCFALLKAGPEKSTS
jgi:nitrate/nitrite transporter NarK